MSSENKKSGVFDTIMQVLISVLFIGMVILMICLPYIMARDNQKTKEQIAETGIQERIVTITDKEIIDNTDSEGGGSSNYMIYFDGGHVDSSSWYKKLEVGDEVTVYTVNGKRYEFSKDELVYSDSEINISLLISNNIVAVIVGILIYTFYNKFFKKRANVEETVTRKLTVSDTIIYMLILAQILSLVETGSLFALFVLIILVVWQIVRKVKKRKTVSA